MIIPVSFVILDVELIALMPTGLLNRILSTRFMGTHFLSITISDNVLIGKKHPSSTPTKMASPPLAPLPKLPVALTSSRWTRKKLNTVDFN